MVEVYWYEFGLKNKIKVAIKHYPKPLISSISILFTLLLHIRWLNYLLELHRKRIKVQKAKAYHEQSQIHH